MEEGKTVTLKATVQPSSLKDVPIKWESDNKEFATVEDGVVTAVKAGSTTVKASINDGAFTAEVKVTVKPKSEE